MAPTTVAATTTTGSTVATGDRRGRRPASQDAFAGGWFDDGAAWPQIVLWGLLLAAIAVGGYLLAKRQAADLARRARRRFVPFVVVLYFWFENVNRLLPPGL